MTKNGIETRRCLGIFLLAVAVFCSFGAFGGALNWASSPEGGAFYWVVTLVVAVVFIVGLISMYQRGKDFLEFYDEIIRRDLDELHSVNEADRAVHYHLSKSKTFRKHWHRKTCTKN